MDFNLFHRNAICSCATESCFGQYSQEFLYQTVTKSKTNCHGPKIIANLSNRWYPYYAQVPKITIWLSFLAVGIELFENDLCNFG